MSEVTSTHSRYVRVRLGYTGSVFGFHPANLAFRFVLEIAALVAIGIGAYAVGSGPFAWVLGIGLPTGILLPVVTLSCCILNTDAQMLVSVGP